MASGKEYTLFVLSTNNSSGQIITDDTTDKTVASVNLILDRNMYYNSEAKETGLTDSSRSGLVIWYSEYNNTNGPVTAMNYLYNITKDWNKVPNIKMNYTDEGSQYGMIITSNDVTKITKKRRY